jgi:hypothetical protein
LTLLTPWLLAGLLALAPLLALHLRRRRRRQEVASLLLWQELPAAAPGRRRATLVPSLLLLLQALIVVLLVLALARPASERAAEEVGAAPQVLVLDGSRAMAATDVAPDRLATARRLLDQRLDRLDGDTPVSVVLAGASPRLLAERVTPEEAREALAGVRATAPRADLRAGLALAAGQLHRAGGTVTLVHAVDDPAPRVSTDGVTFAAEAIGSRDAADVRLEQPVARCTPAPEAATASGTAASGATTPAEVAAPACTVFAAVRNDGSSATSARLVVEQDGAATASRTLALARGERVEVTFPAEAGARLTVRLDGADGSSGAGSGGSDRDGAAATVVVPRPDAPATVTLVSDRPATAPLARALAATPGVALRSIAPDAYEGGDADAADLLVLDRWLPDGGLPSASALLLVAPPRLPGGALGAPLADPALSGTVAADPLLDGVDLAGVALDAGAVRRATLPEELRALAWAPGGPLLAAAALPGERPQRIALLTFDPQRSTLPQLPAFPILLGNIVAWARGGVGSLAASDATTPILLRAGDGGGIVPGPPREWWPWLVVVGFLLLLAEWSYPRWSHGGREPAR